MRLTCHSRDDRGIDRPSSQRHVPGMQFAELGFREILRGDQLIARALERSDDFIDFQLHRQRFFVLDPLNENTIKNVVIVVPVLITIATCRNGETVGPSLPKSR